MMVMRFWFFIREGSIDSLLERLGAHKSTIDRKEQTGEYGVGAQILTHFGVTKMTLLSNKMPKLIGLEAYELEIVGLHPLTNTRA